MVAHGEVADAVSVLSLFLLDYVSSSSRRRVLTLAVGQVGKTGQAELLKAYR